MIRYVETLPYRPCRPLFQTRLKQILPQQQKLQTFIDSNYITDVYYESVDYLWVLDLPEDQIFDLVVFVVNPRRLISVLELDELLLELKPLVGRYFYLAINKFLLYSDTVIEQPGSQDFDQKLLLHWQDLLDMQVVWADADSNDRGTLGNFVHPVTNMMLRL